MSYPIVLIYPDCDATDTGQIYLPGEPVRLDGESCGICGTAVDGHPDYYPTTLHPSTGVHLGYVQITGSAQGLDEWCHLRCVMDCTDEGTLGITTPGAWLPDTGRHFATAPDRSWLALAEVGGTGTDCACSSGPEPCGDCLAYAATYAGTA